MICFEISPADVETVPCCPLCAHPRYREVSRVCHRGGTEFLTTARCNACGFVFRRQRPVKNWFSRAFADRERLQSQQGVSALNPEIEQERYHRYLQLGRMLATENATCGGLRTVLDIGCGPGTGLKAFQDVGFDATGVDEDNTRARHGLALGLDIAVTPWESYRPPTKYDFITCLHSIEHFHDPRCLLDRLRDWLKPGGKLVIEVPNLKHFVTDWTDALYLAHMANYTPSTLRALGRSACFAAGTRLRYYDVPARNDENLCLSFSLGTNESVEPRLAETVTDDEPAWSWLATTYGAGLAGNGSAPYFFDVPFINDISLTYKNCTRVSANLRENLHMRTAQLDSATGRHRVS